MANREAHNHMQERLHTIIEVAGRLERNVDSNGRVEHGGGLAETALPGNMVGQLAKRVGDAAQVDAAVALPGAPRHLAVRRAHAPAPGP